MYAFEPILKEIEAMQDKLTAMRRDFHHYPETGFLEMRTSAIIAKRLTELGYEVLTGSWRSYKQTGSQMLLSLHHLL